MKSIVRTEEGGSGLGHCPLAPCGVQPGPCPVIDPILRLYVAGTSATARRAERQLAELQAHIKPACKVEIIDVQERPNLAEKAGILATPTLVYEDPERSRRIVGDLGDTRRVLEFLGIEPKGKPA
jgi:circadian clock protein KaiB